MFNKCCNSSEKASYQISHNPRPLILAEEMESIIKRILWYVPNIDSYQAPKNELISDKLYDDFSFTFILKKMGMNESDDVLWLDPKDCISNEMWDFYQNEICTNCQKVIISRCKKLSKTNDLLRCLRNCVAHGHFSIVNDFIIGFNLHQTKKNPEGEKNAILKIQPQKLLRAIDSLTSPQAKELLIGYAFERVGYTYTLGTYFDLTLQKGDKKYVVEIKSFKGQRYLHLEELQRFLVASEKDLPEYERILFIDTSRVTKEVRAEVEKIDNFRIVDLGDVKKMIGDDPIDILA